jgi:hypothetical protein
VDGWASETRPVDKAVYEWRRVFRQLASFLKHDDATRLRTEDLIAWKAALIEAGLRPKTIRDAKLAPVRAILQWTVDNHRLPENPAKRVVIDVKIKPADSKRSFSDDARASDFFPMERAKPEGWKRIEVERRRPQIRCGRDRSALAAKLPLDGDHLPSIYHPYGCCMDDRNGR